MKIKVTPLKKFEEEVASLIKSRTLLSKDYDEFKGKLAEAPESGPVITKTGGIRKVRMKSAAKGKSGGFRVCYFYAVDRNELILICIYGKNKQDTLSEEEKKELKALVSIFKKGKK